jgi:hypothetical protein
MNLTVEHVCAWLVRHRVRPRAEVKALYQRWRNEGKGQPADARRFLDWLVAQQYLTAVEADLLLKGRGLDRTRSSPPADAAAAWDVELIHLPMQEVVFSIRGLAVSRRDLLMLGVGAGGVATLGLLGLALTSLRKPRRAEPPSPAGREDAAGDPG